MKAHELINSPDKWCQGRYTKADGEMCAEEAIYRAYPNDWERNRACTRVENCIKDSYASIPAWNDANCFEVVHGLLETLDI